MLQVCNSVTDFGDLGQNNFNSPYVVGFLATPSYSHNNSITLSWDYAKTRHNSDWLEISLDQMKLTLRSEMDKLNKLTPESA